MELETVKDSENKLIGRREIEFYIVQEDKTPKKEEVKTALCKKLNLSPETTVIVRIDQAFGARQCSALAHSYSDAKSMARFEQKHLSERKGKKAKKPAEAKSDAKAPEGEKK